MMPLPGVCEPRTVALLAGIPLALILVTTTRGGSLRTRRAHQRVSLDAVHHPAGCAAADLRVV
ncbi:hypothetical protein [Paraburkholderia sp.]|uniref:hypothetical protein n=1 Tax=Paraburkholderia sp. TaxID=1926495 RepID=UPI003D6F9E51